jgi:hypothetical protein
MNNTNGAVGPRALSETSDDCSLNSVDLDPMGENKNSSVLFYEFF